MSPPSWATAGPDTRFEQVLDGRDGLAIGFIEEFLPAVASRRACAASSAHPTDNAP